jgi:hypothetical protein
MTDEQGLTLARMMRDFKASGARIVKEPFDLPDGYIGVTLDIGNAGTYEAGVAPNGDASS